ncbi:fungal-specific transcription factor domain-containing protein [Ilyonectria robusta]|uniref:fungal-specific transcription factor domain-containing protein n=1 Tax=Ilyonectria robusta TaxID=1079257 RepID=UPI001E8EB646|nr:fungal-specific transcription factor domain-containing protein [Ilyonectria robusta]KAH8662771.1 fungal-specific transcription factor domain-containing protein [Ilyonectria robusta]
MAEPLASPDEASLEDLTPEEASRKVQYGTACWACRQRKVRCDNKQPCENCVERDYAQLCSYEPNHSYTSKQVAVNSKGSKARKRRHSAPYERDEVAEQEQRRSNWLRTIGNADEPDATEASRFLGQNSIPVLLREQSSPDHQNPGGAVTSDIHQSMGSILGLDTSAPFPLMSSRHLNWLAQDISSELPSDREVEVLFQTYKEIPQPFWGFVVNWDDLESKLMVYLEDRSRNARSSVKSGRPVSASWLAVLFAVLAVGSQYNESPYDVRTRDSQKYIQISSHFLRLGNFLLRPTFDSIQALLLTSFALLNDMKAEASWALLGLTCRLAQSLGLHVPHTPDGRESGALDMAKGIARRRIWWTCVWHDTLASLSFDRSPMTNIPSCSIPVCSENPAGGYTYLETMYHLIQIISRRLNPDVIATASYTQILDNCEAVEALLARATPQIQHKEHCKTAVDRLQYFAIRLHTSYITSVACRPSLRRDCTKLDAGQKHILAERCKVNLTETVRMFLAMHQLSVIPTRSWAFTYHGLSSALLLGILSDTRTDPEVRRLQGDLIAALSVTAKEQGDPQSQVPNPDKDIELSGPLWRALAALKNIYDHGSVVGSGSKKRRDSSNDDRSPLSALPPDGQAAAAATTHPRQQGDDPHQDAGLARAQQNNMDVDNLGGVNVDPASYMAPMDLYESIWVGKGLSGLTTGADPTGIESVDPWNTTMDSMSFELFGAPASGQPQQSVFLGGNG